jgi:hypothetical protein
MHRAPEGGFFLLLLFFPSLKNLFLQNYGGFAGGGFFLKR